MSLGRRKEEQKSMWLSYDQLPQSQGHVLYERLQKLLRKASFDTFLEKLCAPFYAEKLGRRSIPPGRSFRMLLIGSFEGIRFRARHLLGKSQFASWQISGHRRLWHGGECGHEKHCAAGHG